MPKKILDITTRYIIEDRGYNSPCWIWTGATVKFRHLIYGKLRVGKNYELAHRHMYRLHIGLIPSGLELDHLCRITLCCNPAHLEPVTHSLNMRRGENIGKWKRKKAL